MYYFNLKNNDNILIGNGEVDIMVITTLRIDEETYDEIVEIADNEERSVNSQILYMLKKYLEQLKEKN